MVWHIGMGMSRTSNIFTFIRYYPNKLLQHNSHNSKYNLGVFALGIILTGRLAVHSILLEPSHIFIILPNIPSPSSVIILSFSKQCSSWSIYLRPHTDLTKHIYIGLLNTCLVQCGIKIQIIGFLLFPPSCILICLQLTN